MKTLPRNKIEDMILVEWIKNFTIEAERQLTNFSDKDLNEETMSHFQEEYIIGEYE